MRIRSLSQVRLEVYHLTLQGCIHADPDTLVVLPPIIYPAGDLSVWQPCRSVILPEHNYPVTSMNMKYRTCDQTITCSEIGSNVGPGCYCEEGYRLNISTGRCVPLSSCPSIGQSSNDHLLNLSECNNEPVHYFTYTIIIVTVIRHFNLYDIIDLILYSCNLSSNLTLSGNRQ